MLFAGSKSRRIVVAPYSRGLCKTAISVLESDLESAWGQHEYGNRLRPHAGSMGNVEGASRPGIEVSRSESIRCRTTHRTSPRSDVRQFADYYIGRTQGSDQGLIQIAGRGGLTFRQSLKPLAGVPSASYGRHSQDISQDILPSNHHSRIEIKFLMSRSGPGVPARPCGGPGIGTKCRVRTQTVLLPGGPPNSARY
jgi:hypothetical protein